MDKSFEERVRRIIQMLSLLTLEMNNYPLSAELEDLDESALVEYLSNYFPIPCLDIDEKLPRS